MVMEVTEDPQIEVSLKMSHLIQHISKLGHVVEKQKSYSQNIVAKFYITGPLSIKNSFLSYSELQDPLHPVWFYLPVYISDYRFPQITR